MPYVSSAAMAAERPTLGLLVALPWTPVGLVIAGGWHSVGGCGGRMAATSGRRLGAARG